MEEQALYNVFTTDTNHDKIEQAPSRRQLACGLDELEREAFQFERTLIQMLNQVRAIQGKAPVKPRD